MFKELFNFKNKSTQESGTKMFVIASMVFVSYYIVKTVYAKVENFDPHAQTNKIGECDVGTPNAGSKWYNYINKQ